MLLAIHYLMYTFACVFLNSTLQKIVSQNDFATFLNFCLNGVAKAQIIRNDSLNYVRHRTKEHKMYAFVTGKKLLQRWKKVINTIKPLIKI